MANEASPNLFCPGCGYALDGWVEPRLRAAEARADGLEAENTELRRIGQEFRNGFHRVSVEAGELELECRRLRGVKTAAQKLLALMDGVDVDPQLGDGTDRVFPRYEFDELRAALAPPEAQAGPALVELPTTAKERREITGILGVPEEQIHKLDLVPDIPGCPFCGAAPSRVNGISLVDPEKEYFVCPNGHTERLSKGEWCARYALSPEAQGREEVGRE